MGDGVSTGFCHPALDEPLGGGLAQLQAIAGGVAPLGMGVGFQEFDVHQALSLSG